MKPMHALLQIFCSGFDLRDYTGASVKSCVVKGFQPALLRAFNRDRTFFRAFNHTPVSRWTGPSWKFCRTGPTFILKVSQNHTLTIRAFCGCRIMLPLDRNNVRDWNVLTFRNPENYDAQGIAVLCVVLDEVDGDARVDEVPDFGRLARLGSVAP